MCGDDKIIFWHFMLQFDMTFYYKFYFMGAMKKVGTMILINLARIRKTRPLEDEF